MADSPTSDKIDAVIADVKLAAVKRPQLGGVANTIDSWRDALDANDFDAIRSYGTPLQQQMLGGDWTLEADQAAGRLVAQTERLFWELVLGQVKFNYCGN